MADHQEGTAETRTPAGETGCGSAPLRQKLRIFLSYGHDEFKSLAEQLVHDLKDKRGYEVWFDDIDLHVGHDWEQLIENGLEAIAQDVHAGRLLLLMTPHSVRRPGGYCLNELERALDRHVPVIPVMVVSVEPPLSICRLQRLDMRGCVPIDLHPGTYEQKFQQLCNALERLSFTQEGEEGRLRRALNPTWYEGELRYHLPRFMGRQWLWRVIDTWLADPNGPQVFWITGAPGSGKSAIAAWLSEHQPEISALHVCWYAEKSETDPRQLVRSIAWQLSTQSPDVFSHLSAMGDIEAFCQDNSAEALFERLIIQVVHSIPIPDKPVVILIDGLDAATVDGVNPVANLLGRAIVRLPRWLRFVLTSESSSAVSVPLQKWTPFPLSPASADNLKDVSAYIHQYIAPLFPQGELSQTVHERLVAISEGNWLYLEKLREELADGRLPIDALDAFPPGLGAAYYNDFQLRFHHPHDPDRYRELYGPCLALILSACEPLRVVDMARVLGVSASKMQDRLNEFGALLMICAGRVHLYHQALHSWLTDEARSAPYSVNPFDGHQMLAQDGWAQFEQSVRVLSAYSKCHLPRHLQAAEDWDKLERCVTDAEFIAYASKQHRLFDLAQYWKLFAPSRLENRCAMSFDKLAGANADIEITYDAANGLGQLFQHMGLYRPAIHYLQKALQLAGARHDDNTLGYANLNIGWCLRHTDQFKLAIDYACKAIESFQASGNQEGLARAHSVIGMCYWHLQDDEAARQHLLDSIALYQDVRDASSEAEALNHLGIIYRSLGLHDNALEKLRAGEQLYLRFQDEKGLGKCLNSLGTVYWWRGELEKALRCYRNADRINKKLNQPYIRGLTANNLGYVLLERGQARRALKAFRYARSIRHQLGSKGYEMMDLSGMALACLHLNRDGEARRLSRQAIEGLEHINTVEDIERAYLNHYQILKRGAQAEQTEALQALQKAEALVNARLARIKDPAIQTVFKAAVPPVRAVLACAAELRMGQDQ